MANRLYNKQVSPKGYKAGGRVKEEPMRDRMKQPLKRKAGPKAGRKKEDSSRTLGKFMKAKIDSTESTVKKGGMGADRFLSKYRNPKRAEKFIKSGGFRKNAKDAAYYKSIGLTGKRGDQAVKRFFKKMGGSLKPVQPNQKGLSKLPTKVRNKMGYMKKGGVVSDAKKKQFKENKAGQKSFNKKAMKIAKGVLNFAVPAVGAAEVGKKIARKFKGAK